MKNGDNQKVNSFGDEIEYFTEENFNQDFVQFIGFVNKYLAQARINGKNTNFCIHVKKKDNKIYYFTCLNDYPYDDGYIRLSDEAGLEKVYELVQKKFLDNELSIGCIFGKINSPTIDPIITIDGNVHLWLEGDFFDQEWTSEVKSSLRHK